MQKRQKKQLKNKIFLGLAGLLLSGASCASDMQILLTPGIKNFSFSLSSNPTTGYHWVIATQDKKKVKLNRSYYQSSQQILMGAGGQQVFDFTVLHEDKKLDTTIRLLYARSWEKKPVKIQFVHIKSRN